MLTGVVQNFCGEIDADEQECFAGESTVNSSMALLLKGFLAKLARPSLQGEERLEGSDRDVCQVSGVMLGARKQFLSREFGDATFYDVVSCLSPTLVQAALNPTSSAWLPFSALVEFDRVSYQRLGKIDPLILASFGAASAELGIGKVYRKLDVAELKLFLEQIPRLNHVYQRFGRAEVLIANDEATVSYFDYPCYSRYYCSSAPGYFMEALLRHGAMNPDVKETKCFAWGDTSCEFDLSWR